MGESPDLCHSATWNFSSYPIVRKTQSMQIVFIFHTCAFGTVVHCAPISESWSRAANSSVTAFGTWIHVHCKNGYHGNDLVTMCDVNGTWNPPITTHCSHDSKDYLCTVLCKSALKSADSAEYYTHLTGCGDRIGSPKSNQWLVAFHICCYLAWHSALIGQDKDWLPRCQHKVALVSQCGIYDLKLHSPMASDLSHRF